MLTHTCTPPGGEQNTFSPTPWGEYRHGAKMILKIVDENIHNTHCPY